MKLYYKPGACSLASHIALRELDLEFSLLQVDTAEGRAADGVDFRDINPDGYVPALALDDGEVLTEGAAILQYLADKRPEVGLAPPLGSIERSRMQQELNFTASELHKAFSPFFSAAPPEGTARTEAKARVAGKMAHFERLLSDGRSYLLGETFSVADAYFHVVAGWSAPCGFSLADWPHVAAYQERLSARPTVQAAMRAEGLLQ